MTKRWIGTGRVGTLALVSVMLLGAIAPVWGQGDRKADRPKKQKKEKYAVVHIGERVQVMLQSEVVPARKQVDQDYREAVQSWQQAKRDAKKSKEKFTDKKPVPTVFKIVASNLASEEAAEAKRKKYEAALSSKGTKKSGKFAVVAINGEYRVLPAKEVAKVKRDVAAEHRAAMKEYSAAKAAAKKAGEEFTEPRPVKGVVKVISAKFATADLAQAHLEKITAKVKPEDKEGAAPTPEGSDAPEGAEEDDTEEEDEEEEAPDGAGGDDTDE